MLPGPGLVGPGLLFLWALAHVVQAQLAIDCNDPSTTVEIDTDANATAVVQKCPASNITIDLDGINSSGDIAFDGLQTCGNLTCLGDGNLPDLIIVRSNSLSVITTSLNFQEIPGLQTLSFPNLTHVGGNDPGLWLIGLPRLTEFKVGFSLSVNDMFIQSTGLKSFSPPLSSQSKVIDVDIINNAELSQISLEMESWQNGLTIAGNAPGALINLTNARSGAYCQLGEFSALNIPKLQYVSYGFNISNAAVPRLSAPSLQNVSHGFGLTGVYLPVLSVVDGDLNFRGAASSPADFSSLEIPELQSVSGDLWISNLQVFNFSAPSLRSVGRDFYLTGNFSEINVPKLTSIIGNVYVRGASGLDCSLFRAIDVQGFTDCTGTAVAVSKPTTTSSISTATSPATSHTSSTSPTTSTGLSSAAKTGIGGGVGGGAALIIMGLAIWYSLKKRRSTEPKLAHGKASPVELPRGYHYERSELEASPNQVSELEGDRKLRPRSVIESEPVLAPSYKPAMGSKSEEMKNARMTNPAELDFTG